MYKFVEGQVLRTEHSTIPYTWIQREEPNDSICIMLPGVGYTTQRPLFHYATSVCLHENVDVFHINYNFVKNKHFMSLSEEEQRDWMYEDVRSVVKEVLKDTNYDQCFLLSKSIGTIPMAIEWNQKNLIRNPFGIWLTPLLKEAVVYETLLKTDIPSLSIIGDKDHHFIEERVAELNKNAQITTLIVPEADHSLEIQGDISVSMEALKIIMETVQDYIRSHRILNRC